jgi:hypothetical protein
MIADALRRDLDVRVAITPKIRADRTAESVTRPMSEGMVPFLAPPADLAVR